MKPTGKNSLGEQVDAKILAYRQAADRALPMIGVVCDIHEHEETAPPHMIEKIRSTIKEYDDCVDTLL